MTTSHENVNWMKLTRVFSKKPLNPRATFCASTFTSTFLIVFFNVCPRKNQHLPLVYTMYANVSNYTPPCTYVSLNAVWRVHPPGQNPSQYQCALRTVLIHITTRAYNSLSPRHTHKNNYIWLVVQFSYLWMGSLKPLLMLIVGIMQSAQGLWHLCKFH